MIISVFKQVTKRDSRIIESFSFSPKKKIIWRDGTRIKDYLIYISNKISISDEYELLSRQEHDYFISKEYAYTENKRIPNQSLSYSFSYIPFLGKKKCSKCFFARISKKGDLYCSGRFKKIRDDYWNDCLYYYENSILIEKTDSLKSIEGKVYQDER
jgi:hypothetical protein